MTLEKPWLVETRVDPWPVTSSSSHKREQEPSPVDPETEGDNDVPHLHEVHDGDEVRNEALKSKQQRTFEQASSTNLFAFHLIFF